MLPIHKIVCPTDFSDPSYEGLKVAKEFAEQFSAVLILEKSKYHTVATSKQFAVNPGEKNRCAS